MDDVKLLIYTGILFFVIIYCYFLLAVKMETYKKILLVVFVVIVLFLLAGRYYQMATERGCGYNPINQLKASFNECWCFADSSEIGDLAAASALEDRYLVAYGGFRCDNCIKWCNKMKKQLK